MSLLDEPVAMKSIVHRVIDAKFDAAMPDWWPDTEEWAEEIVEKLRETDQAR